MMDINGSTTASAILSCGLKHPVLCIRKISTEVFSMYRMNSSCRCPNEAGDHLAHDSVLAKTFGRQASGLALSLQDGPVEPLLPADTISYAPAGWRLVVGQE